MATWEVRFDLDVDLRDPRLLQPVYAAQELASVINGIPLPPLTRSALNRLNIVRAVRGTTGIEGSDLSEDEVEQVLFAPNDSPVLPRARDREEREVRNASRVMESIARMLDRDPTMPLSEEIIREFHRRTTEGIDYPNNEPGEYRRHPVSAGEYVPPRDGDEVRRLMAEFLRWLNGTAAGSWPVVVRAVAAHFYFISIHPFGDGNGRTARAIESYLLYQDNVNKLGFYSLSNFYYRRRADYIEILDFVRFRSGGSLTRFLVFAANGLLEELQLIRDEVLMANKKVAFRDYANELLHGEELAAKVRIRLLLVMRAIEHDGELLERAVRSGAHPVAALYASLGDRAFARDLRRLQEYGLVVIMGGVIRPNFGLMDRYSHPFPG